MKIRSEAAGDVRFKNTKGIKLIGQWNAVGDAKGVAVFECDDPMAIAKSVKDWSDLMSIEIYPAIGNESIAKLIA